MDPRVQQMADVLVSYSVAVKKNDWVVISTTTLGEPLANACASAVLRASGHPTVMLMSEDTQEIMLHEANDEQLTYLSPLATMMYERADVSISLLAPRNTRSLSNVDPSRMALQQKSRESILETYLRRAASGELRWTVAAYPTPAAAQDAGMSLREYEDFVYGAGLLEEPDPVAAWKRLGQRQQRLIDWLSDKKTVHITGPDTDLTLSVEGRTWINDEGLNNFPGGEIFTGPVEHSAEGEILFNYPANLNGREVRGIRLSFEDGRVISAGAQGDDGYLQELLDMDDGARRLGEFAFGTNSGIREPSRNTLFDEKIGGTLHMALGRSYPETGGTNTSALHWDMVYNLREGSEVRVDGELFSRNGEFCV